MGIYVKKTWLFDITIEVNGSAVDITPDTVTVYIDKSKTRATPSIEKAADVATEGASGIAKFEITPAEMAIKPGTYNVQVIWQLVSGRKFVVYDSTQEILELVKDE